MHMTLSLWLVIAFGLAGCSAHGGLSSQRERDALEARQARYHAMASEARPDTWRDGAEWEFTALDNGGGVAESFVFRVTEMPQETCLSGDWRKLVIVRGDGTRLRNPAYAVDGRNLHILLSTALCDAYPMYEGELSDMGFTGTHNFSHMLGSEEHGKVSGKPVHLSP